MAGRWIAILEDTPARVDAMRPILRSLLPRYEVVVHDNATDFIDWLADGLADTALLCLDHDLGPNRVRDGQTFDPGTGRDVADFLSVCPPVCPVIVHSSNSMAVPGMMRVLSESGWTCSYIYPADDLKWIPTAWRAELERYLSRGFLSA